MTRRAMLALALAISAAPGRAETLADAVGWAMAGNPTLAAARARQDSLAQTPDEARAAGRLTASADTTGGYDRFDFGRGGGADVSASLPVWTGGRVSSAVRAANGDVSAGEQNLRDTAADVITQVIAAYSDVLLQQQAVAIAQADITLLDSQVAEAKARFDLGTQTQTDVARLVAEREDADGTLAAAQAALAGAAAAYRAVVGREPGALAPAPAALGGLPPSLAEAERRSLASNPAYLASLAARGAAEARIGVARANSAPSLALAGSYGYGVTLGQGGGGYVRSTAAGLTLHVPLLTGGLVAAQTRAARADARAAGADAETAARSAVRDADTAFANVVAARSRVASGERGVAAATRALAGVKAEYAVALRSTLDILIADESLRGAQLSLAQARADLLVDEAALLRATGALEPAAIE